MSKEAYQPTPEEISEAEGHMTETQRKMSDSREQVVGKGQAREYQKASHQPGGYFATQIKGHRVEFYLEESSDRINISSDKTSSLKLDGVLLTADQKERFEKKYGNLLNVGAFDSVIESKIREELKKAAEYAKQKEEESEIEKILREMGV